METVDRRHVHDFVARNRKRGFRVDPAFDISYLRRRTGWYNVYPMDEDRGLPRCFNNLSFPLFSFSLSLSYRKGIIFRGLTY